MSLKLTSFLPVLLLPAFYGLNSPSDKAIPLITMNENAGDGEDDFVLNPKASLRSWRYCVGAKKRE